MSRTLALTLVALCASAPTFAQQAATAAPARTPASATFAQRGTTAAPVAVAQGGTPAPAAAHTPDPGLDSTDANVTIEITVVDKMAGSTATTTRQGAITVANLSRGSVRGLSSDYSSSATKMDPVGLDIDARTWLRKSGMVSAELTVAYIPSGMDPTRVSIQRQSATLFLKPGQETQVLTAGSMSGQGPAVKITAKATVIK